MSVEVGDSWLKLDGTLDRPHVVEPGYYAGIGTAWVPIQVGESSGGLTQDQVDARIAPYARAAPTGQIGDAQIPAGIARDSEIPDVSGFITSAQARDVADAQARARFTDAEKAKLAGIEANAQRNVAPTLTTRGQKLAVFADLPQAAARGAIIPGSLTLETGVPAGFSLRTGRRGLIVPARPPNQQTDGFWAVALVNNVEVAAAKIPWGPGSIGIDSESTERAIASLVLGTDAKIDVYYQVEPSGLQYLELHGDNDALAANSDVSIYLAGAYVT